MSEQAPAPAPSIHEQFMSRLEAEETPTSLEQPADILHETGEETEGLAEPQGDQLEDTSEEVSQEQPDAEVSEGINVNGRQYTAEELSEALEAGEGFKKGFYEKSQQLARIPIELRGAIQQVEGLQEDIQARFAFPKAQLEKDWQSINQVDVSQIPQDRYAEFQARRAQIQQAYRQIAGAEKQALDELKARRDDLRQKEDSASIELLQLRHPETWGAPAEVRNRHYAELRDFALENRLMTADEFDDTADYRIIEWLEFQKDKASMSKVMDRKVEKPRKAVSRNAPQQARNAQGQFTTAQNAVLESNHAINDGSFREMLRAKLEAEDR